MLRVRWLGRARYRDAHALQHAIMVGTQDDDYLLLMEHPSVYSLGVRARMDDVLVPPASVGAEMVRADRGGLVTYHGPGQLVGYPLVKVPVRPGATPGHIRAVEEVVIRTLGDLGLAGTGRLDGHPGVWVDPDGPAPRKICAVGTRVSRGRSMHGFALNVDPDLAMFAHIVPCGISDKAVTSLAAEDMEVAMPDVVDAIVTRATEAWASPGAMERQDVGDRRTSLQAGARPAVALPLDHPADELPVGPLAMDVRKPGWLRVKAQLGPEYRAMQRTMRGLDLITVCEEAGCPNIFECWADGTATFMINGSRCTRACGFCLVDSGRPLAADPEEPERVAQAVARLGLDHAVVTAVARDDLPDGGAAGFAATIAAIHRRCAGTAVEVLIPDCKGDDDALAAIFETHPEVLNHNLETVARLQRAVRPSASYARSLSVLGRAKKAGLVTKSGLMLGLGETEAEVCGALADLRAVGVDIVTMGQYLRPTADHLPVARWWSPEEMDDLRAVGEDLGFAHVEASPLTRSSYHAKAAAASAQAVSVGAGHGCG